MKSTEAINALISNEVGGIESGDISDGYHTFNELYEHRVRLFIELCRCYQDKAWYSLKHSDDSLINGWFVLGLNKEEGKQITYHLPMEHFKEVGEFAEELKKAPEFDGHSSKDVLNRLKNL